jgi:hypothetical protein
MKEERSATQGGLSLTTLMISSASAVVAATVVPLFWSKGTVIATALTPVITAIASEMLSRPVEKIPTVGVWRQTASGTAIRERVAVPDHEVVETRRIDDDHVAVPPVPHDEPERRRRLNGRMVRLGLLTGALAFVIAAVVVTATELTVFGGSVGADERRTSLFGGRDTDEPAATATPEPEATAAPGATPTATPSATPEATPTPSATPTATATTAPPAEAAPEETPQAVP